MAGAPIPRETAQEFLDRGITPQNIYGMTENGSHQYTLPGDDARTIVATCGRACRGYEIRIFKPDDPDIEAAPGEVGEIGGRGGVLTLGYFDDQLATEASFNRGGWFMSGDLGRLDANGYLEILGRKKDLIIRGGHNIYPARIEDLAMRHAGDRARRGVCRWPTGGSARKCASRSWREAARARADGRAGASARRRACRSTTCRNISWRSTEFPLTASGKVLKRELVEWAKAGRIALEPVQWREPEEKEPDMAVHLDPARGVRAHHARPARGAQRALARGAGRAGRRVRRGGRERRARAPHHRRGRERVLRRRRHQGADGPRPGAATSAAAERGQAVFAKLDRLPILSVALVNGYAFGGGLELALACTFRLATPQRALGLPEIKLGLIPGYGGTQRLPRLIGEARAIEMILSGRTVDAEEAQRIGLVNRLVDGDPVDGRHRVRARA